MNRVVICRSNPIAPDPRVERIATCLSDIGLMVTLVGWDRGGNLPTQQNEGKIEIVLLSIQAEYGSGLANLPALLRWQVGLLVWLMRNRSKYDIIHACDFDTVLPALIVKFLYGKSVVYDIFDFYADHLRKTPAFLKRWIRWLDLWAISRVNAVIVVDEARKAQIVQSEPHRIVVIYNTPDDRRQVLQESKIRRPMGSEFHLAYVGLLHIERGLLELLEILEQHPEWSLDMAGFGGDAAVVIPKAESLPNVYFYGRISYERAMELTWSADALIGTYDPRIPNHRYASPNKLFEAMMLGKPIVVAAGTNIDRIVEEAGCGIVVPYGEITEIERVLSKLARDEALRTRLGEAGRKAYDTRFNWNIMRRRLIDLYRTL